MKNITIQPLSALAGAGVVLLASLAAGSLKPSSSFSQPLAIDMLPRANSHVRILEGETYMVPSGKLLTITTFGVADGFPAPGLGIHLKFDGQPVFFAGMEGVQQLSLGVTAESGVAVTVEDADALSTSVVLGYLSKG